jgi:integrase/recombinase XerD
MSKENVLLAADRTLSIALQNAISLWADARTDPGSARRRDLLRDKTKAATDFFVYTDKHPAQVTALDVKAWQVELERSGLSASTIYARISRVSSFYEWAMDDPDLCQEMPRNPVHLARPKAPKAYQTESTQALSDEEVKALLAVVKSKADGGDIVGKRDYALLLLFFATGMRRSEVMCLRWGDVKINDTVTVTSKVKGGDYAGREIADPRVKDALLDYLRASRRLGAMDMETPLWTSHDRTKLRGGEQLTGHAFAKRVKVYARWAGIGDIHLHQTRHTFARWVSESTGSIIETQDALGHKHAATTRVYVQRVSVQKDKHSAAILDRLDV